MYCFFSFAHNDWLCDVPANSPSALAWSEFAVGWVRWHGRIADVGGSFTIIRERKTRKRA